MGGGCERVVGGADGAGVGQGWTCGGPAHRSYMSFASPLFAVILFALAAVWQQHIAEPPLPLPTWRVLLLLQEKAAAEKAAGKAAAKAADAAAKEGEGDADGKDQGSKEAAKEGTGKGSKQASSNGNA